MPGARIPSLTHRVRPGTSRRPRSAPDGFQHAWVHDAGDELEELVIVIGKVDGRWYLDVFYDGAWLDHGFAHVGEENSVFWAGRSADGISDTDPTMCRCQNGSDMHVCSGIDGSTKPSDVMICD